MTLSNMEYYQQRRLLFFSIVVLVVLNVSSLGALWMATYSDKGHHGSFSYKGHEHGQTLLSEKLNLSEEQATAFKVLRQNHFEKEQMLLQKKQITKNAFFDLMSSEQPNQALVSQLADEIGTVEAQINMEMSEHFNQLLNVCNDPQKVILREIFSEMKHQPRSKKRCHSHHPKH